ncbi:hypothetical protein [Alkalimarinus coralli]|uniref:hypothetical protein n=1 Tax=Alkalimarinus coralli TaxID=2935863 RepID=UPI00202B10D7|nr:hypothetical protein [Alkalimarinus coralli]
MSLLPKTFTVRSVFASLFSFLFFGLSLAMILLSFTQLAEGIADGQGLMQTCLKAINTGVIALAVFELAMVINKEYGGDEENHDVIVMLRRTLPRFIGTVCVALALEGLIMVIKYSQLDLAGNLYYPVAIISSAAFLLTALGVFLKLSPDKANNPEAAVIAPHGTPARPASNGSV